MTHSMTAFARRELKTTRGDLSWELRTLNHRYLDISLRLPEAFRGLESAFRERITGRVRRGKLEAVLRFQGSAGGVPEYSLNEPLLDRLLALQTEIENRMENPARPDSIEFLRWPNVLQVVEDDPAELQAEVMQLLEDALDEISQTRAREGATIRALILQRCAEIGEQVSLVREQIPEILARHRSKLKVRLEELEATFDSNRMEQELLYLAQKADVQEEIDRIVVHVEEVQRVLDQDEPAGRRLDFLMQELNREANTLGSKSIDVETTRASVEIKVAIEQIREQIQNME